MNLSNQVAGVDGRQGEPYGLKPLKYYMNPDDMEPSVAQIELFFRSTMRKIHNRYEDKKEMEKDREKWKDIFEELIELPIDNSVYTCYRKLREEAKKSKFELLVETVKEVILTRKKSKVNPNSIRDIKQGPYESVESYNKRFYKALKESEIELDKEITGILSPSDPSPRKNQKYLRSELFYTYKQGLQDKIRSRFPALQVNDMCLDNAMNQAIGIEIENNRLNDCSQRANTNPEFYANQNRKSEDNNKICYNCGKRGHYRKHCRKPRNYF
uniref:CCHC-type domain-containing protein n=1 Tax=Strongyloides stercoralis TaxID=6248 RepID=A0A0K0EMC7_STRER